MIGFIQRNVKRTSTQVIGLTATLLLAASAGAAADQSAGPGQTSGAARQKLEQLVNGDHRTPEQKARNQYRHPVETLSFFGIQPTMTVVELWPGGGWYTSILAPYLKDSGKYYAATMDAAPNQPYNAALKKLLDSRPELYGKAELTVLGKGKYDIAPAGSADMVVTFRNLHNWVWDGIEKDVFAAAFRALKPGGVLGVVEHRHKDANHEPKEKGQAYAGEEYTVKLIEAAGFKLVGRSNVNNNPKDTKDYPKGVWALPPAFAEGDKDRAKYAAIGESDRFTLKFVKPAQ